MVCVYVMCFYHAEAKISGITKKLRESCVHRAVLFCAAENSANLRMRAMIGREQLVSYHRHGADQSGRSTLWGRSNVNRD